MRTRHGRAVLAGAALALWMLAAPALASGVKIGKPAPDFHAVTFDGRHVQLSDFKGQVVVVNLWATWCAPCRKELPLLDTYYRARHANGLEVLAVATEDSLPPATLKPLADVVAFPMVRRMKGPYEIMKAVPTNYIIDRNGVVRYAKAAAFSLDDLNNILIPLLNEPVADAPAPQAP